jgi:hypothetical protein
VRYPVSLCAQEIFLDIGAIEKILFVEPKKIEGSDRPVNPFSVGRKNAVIHFASVGEATNALATFHNYEIDGVQVRRLFVVRLPARRPRILSASSRSVTSFALFLELFIFIFVFMFILFLKAYSGSHQFFSRCRQRRRSARCRGAGAGSRPPPHHY